MKSTTVFFRYFDSSSSFLATGPLSCILYNLALSYKPKVISFPKSWETKALNLVAI